MGKPYFTLRNVKEFSIPSDGDLSLITKGTPIKLRFEFASGGERMWVLVESFDGELGTGILMNSPDCGALPQGAHVAFRREHVTTIGFR